MMLQERLGQSDSFDIPLELLGLIQVHHDLSFLEAPFTKMELMMSSRTFLLIKFLTHMHLTQTLPKNVSPLLNMAFMIFVTSSKERSLFAEYQQLFNNPHSKEIWSFRVE